jgi:hypothetical protein
VHFIHNGCQERSPAPINAHSITGDRQHVQHLTQFLPAAAVPGGTREASCTRRYVDWVAGSHTPAPAGVRSLHGQVQHAAAGRKRSSCCCVWFTAYNVLISE